MFGIESTRQRNTVLTPHNNAVIICGFFHARFLVPHLNSYYITSSIERQYVLRAIPPVFNDFFNRTFSAAISLLIWQRNEAVDWCVLKRNLDVVSWVHLWSTAFATGGFPRDKIEHNGRRVTNSRPIQWRRWCWKVRILISFYVNRRGTTRRQTGGRWIQLPLPTSSIQNSVAHLLTAADHLPFSDKEGLSCRLLQRLKMPESNLTLASRKYM